MKKRILSISMLVAIAITAGWNVYQNESKVALSELGLANVEALARNESSGNKDCYDTITSHKGTKVMYCPICDYVDGTDPWYASSKKC